MLYTGFFIIFRHNVSLKIIGGECKSVTPEMTSSWSETTLPTILSNYKLEDIFKAHYRGRVVCLLCIALEKKEPYPKISILQAMKILADSWEVVTKETIINCFRKAGITPDVQQAAIADSDDPFKDLQESLNDLRKVDSSMVPDDVTATALVSLDDNVIATAPEISRGDIIEELKDRQEPGEEGESDVEISIEEILDPVVEKPSRSAIESPLDALKDAAMFSDEGVQMKSLILSFERLYKNERLKSLKQRDITDFFYTC